MRLIMLAVIVLSTLTASCRSTSPAEEEYYKAVTEIHDRHIEYGGIEELASAKSLCFLSQPASSNLRGFASAVSEMRPRTLRISYGVITSDCSQSDAFLAFDNGKGTAFAMRGDKMRVLGSMRSPSAYAFARAILSAFVDAYGPVR